MEWTKEAEAAVAKVPFFVRKKVKKRVEEEARNCNAEAVALEHVRRCQERFLNNMESEVRGYQVETCFGPGGCPNRAVEDRDMAERLESMVAAKDLKGFLKARVEGPLKMHHELRISLSDCPNACSRPQIVDIGLIGARKPQATDEPCSQCGSCLDACRESALSLSEESDAPALDYTRCLSCGKCIDVCPTGALAESKRGYRVLIGGKLGRHPQLGRELPGIFSREEVLKVVERCIDHYMLHNARGERFGEVLNRVGDPPVE